MSNNSSIGCMSNTDKVLDMLTKARLISHFMANSLLSKEQFGFLLGQSITSNLL